MMAQVEKRGLKLTYPPDFDGELWLELEETEMAVGVQRQFTVTVAATKGETVTQTLRKLGQDLAKCPIHGRKLD